MKLRLGHPTLAQDLAVTRAVRARLPATVQLMVDYNQALSRFEAPSAAAPCSPKAWPGWRSRSATTTSPAMPRSRASCTCRAAGRELRRTQGHAAGAAGRSVRPGDAGCGAHRRRERLDAGGRRGAGARRSHELAPDAGVQRAPAGRDAHLRLAGVRGLDRSDRGRAREDPRRRWLDERPGVGLALGPGAGGALPHSARRKPCR